MSEGAVSEGTLEPEKAGPVMSTLEGCMFVVDDEPYCLRDWDIMERNRYYLDTLNPRYFEHLAKFHAAQLEGEEKQYAAIALRTAYSHALETLFSLICAAVQAPDCIIGWILRYQNIDLVSVVRKISAGEPVRSVLPIPEITWQALAHALISVNTGDPEKDKRIRTHFGDLWERLAGELVDEVLSAEYNSIKHSLRVNMHGVTVWLGPESTPGAPAPPEAMHELGGSEFGTTFYVIEKVPDNRNFRLREQSVNWRPEKFIIALRLISVSISNIVNTLKTWYGGDPTKVEAQFFIDESLYDAPWNYRLSLERFAVTHVTDRTLSQITPLAKADILARYDAHATAMRSQLASTSSEATKPSQPAGNGPPTN